MDKFKKNIALYLFTFGQLVGFTVAHVSLSFPPARKLDSDFLDYGSTKMPCGMPKGKYRTMLKAGSWINVTWNIALPHMGGSNLDLLDRDGNSAMKLTTTNIDMMSQVYSLKLPDMACEDCTIRLLQNIAEAPTKNYGAYSCADVSIVMPNAYKEDCMWRGKPDSNWMCSCEKGYWGNRCQFMDECDNDMDCGPGGKCFEIGITTLPRKQCYCSAGYHGDRCQMRNMGMLPTGENLVLSSYMKNDLSDRMTVYMKMVSDASISDPAQKEMEFVLVVKGTSYGAIGWRPASLDVSCRGMPAIDDGYEDEWPMKPVSPFKLMKMNTSYTPTRPFHPMDCSDIIVGSARGMHSRVRDYYTRDIASPRLDTVYGGTEDITAATGWEYNGVTTIIFRRKVMTHDPTDHVLSGQMQVIWSMGQPPGTSQMQKFYSQDELKYHGPGDMKQRGHTMMTFP